MWLLLAGCAPAPQWLSQTGLYDESGAIAADVESYAPRYELWSDGATKRRFALIPGEIDSSDPDFWQYPEGTKLWKEFSVAGEVVETRLLWKTGGDWVMAAYLWDGDDARLARRGAPNAHGTAHDVPSETQCHVCHDGMPDRVLGFSAVQLAHDGDGVTLASLADRLSDPPDVAPLPGDDTTREALGYLHANCGSCHNDGNAWNPLRLWLNVADLGAVEHTAAYAAIGAQHQADLPPGMPGTLIVPGDPAASQLHARMALRGEGQMPPLGSERVDDVGLAAVDAWITSLSAP